jgi:hypothetical protein
MKAISKTFNVFKIIMTKINLSAIYNSILYYNAQVYLQRMKKLIANYLKSISIGASTVKLSFEDNILTHLTHQRGTIEISFFANNKYLDYFVNYEIKIHETKIHF